MLKQQEELLNRQVVIEARIIEVRLKNQFSQGINWQALTAGFGRATFLPGGALKELASTGTMTILGSARNHDFNTTIRLLSSQGKLSVLSSPRISTLNNQKAIIRVGQSSYYVTGIGTVNTLTTLTPTTETNYNLKEFFSGISLDVTPQISQSGYVTLHIHPSISYVTEDDKKITSNGSTTSIPLASSYIRESDSIVRASDGQVIIIGGLMETQVEQDKNGIPYLKSPIQKMTNKAIDAINDVAGNKDGLSNKIELVILLKPTVISHDSSWKKLMSKVNKQFSD